MPEPKIQEKRWSIEKERELLEIWKKEDWWKTNFEGENFFIIDTPPPYPSPVWHMGALGYAMQDMIARAMRMLGYSVLFPIGIDRNGIPVEWYVERYENIDIWKHDREDFERLCKKHLDIWTKKIVETMKKYGVFGDYEENYYETDSPEYRAITQRSFKILWEKGLIYEENRPNNWCPRCKTTVADAEIEYKEVEGTLYYIRYDVEGGREIIIATTRPELLGGARAILVHPSDERYKEFVGKTAIVPLYGNRIKIYASERADPSFGTGAVHICSYGDFVDVEVFRELGLDPVVLIDTSGKMSENAGKYSGLSTTEAKEKIAEDLEREGFLVKKERIKHRVPIHDKCKSQIEIIPMKEYYLNQLKFVNKMKEIAKNIEFHPERFRRNLLDWIENIKVDWPISRRRLYGTEIPVWTCKNCGYKHVEGNGTYRKPWKEKLDKKCPKCGCDDWEGERRVFDTWMDSSITILFITYWERDREKFKRLFKGTKLRPQGYDIIRTWLYYSLLRTYMLTGKKAFDKIFIHGMGLDERGRKMSKSLGNVVDPGELVDKYGGDCLRLWIALECGVGENFRVNEEKIKGASKFLTKLWNIARFISSFERVDEKPKLNPTDEWILSELNGLIEETIRLYKNMDFHSAAIKLRRFTWNIFADHYIEMVKPRAKKGDRSAIWTLYRCIKSLILLWAPIIPFVTDKIWRSLFHDRSIHYEMFPQKVEVRDLREYTEAILSFNSYVWKRKKEEGLKMRDEIKERVPDELREFEDDLREMHRLKY